MWLPLVGLLLTAAHADPLETTWPDTEAEAPDEALSEELAAEVEATGIAPQEGERTEFTDDSLEAMVWQAAAGTDPWRLGGNSGTNPATHFLGTTDNKALALRVNRRRALILQPNVISPNLIGGSPANFVRSGVRGATISGGGAPSGDSDPHFAFEGPNRVTDAYGTVGGGYNNQAGDNAGTTIDKPFAVVGGGLRNTASGYTSTVAGGFSNIASNTYSTVGGGVSNTASGLYSTVAGGSNTTASGTASFAAGYFARATHGGMFVWADFSTVGPFIPADNSVVPGGLPNGWTAPSNTFNVRARGGVWFVTGFASNGNAVGPYVSAGSGTWQAASSRSYKSDFAPVSAAAVLEEVVRLPVSYWRYQGEGQEARHLGPMSEDFRSAFGLGTDERSIAGVDADGVALAAIQGLNHKLEQENAELKTRLAKLEAKAVRQERIQARLEALEARFERLFQARAE